jgi:hypothetical protein
MKNLLFLFGLLLMSIGSYAQTYTLDTTSGGVECYHLFTTCNGWTNVFLKFNNTNASPVTITWKEIFTTTEFPNPEQGYKDKQLVLPPGETYAIDCSDTTHQACIIGREDVQPTYLAVITQFQFANVVVTQ